MNTMPSFMSRLLAIALLGAGLLAVPGQLASAQADTDAPPSLIQHLRSDLQSSDAMKRENALVDVIALANCPSTCTVNLRSIEEKKLSINNETGTSTIVELDVLIPDLLATYRSGPADGHRLLALSALINIGDEAALEKLVEDGTSSSEKTNRATHKSLAAFYLEKYPELAERTMQTKKLSLDDVHRAKAVRVRQVQN